MSIDKLDFNNTTNDVGEWFINEDLDLAYFFALASDSVPSHTSTDVDSDHALISLHTPIRSSFMVHERANDAYEAFFKMLAKYKGQKPILFGRIESKPITREFGGWFWIPTILSLRAKFTSYDGKNGMRPYQKVWLELRQRKTNTTLTFRTKKESPWLLSYDSKGIGLCVYPSLVGLRTWTVG